MKGREKACGENEQATAHYYRKQRAEVFVALKEGGWSYDRIGKLYDVTGERVRQVVCELIAEQSTFKPFIRENVMIGFTCEHCNQKYMTAEVPRDEYYRTGTNKYSRDNQEAFRDHVRRCRKKKVNGHA